LSEILQQIINGLSLGAIYALIALGYTMVYGVLRFINFAHSEVFMVGAFAGYYLGRMAEWGASKRLHLPPWLIIPNESVWGGTLIILLAMGVCAALGVLIEKLAYRPLRNRPTLTVLITAIGVSLLLQNLGQVVFGPNPKAYPPLFPQKNIVLPGSLTVSSNQIVVLCIAVALLWALRHIVVKTRIDTAMRALSFNPTAASLVGINNDFVISFTFALGSALAAAGGILYALNYPSIDPLMGTLPGLKAFVAAVLGGIGNLPGAALGGLLIGLVETFVRGSHWSTYTDAIVFSILILILLFRPAGLLGKFRTEKV
jgi:branched-chain amino acid transport system permease protein